jgi:hypothetical protein
MFDLIVIFYIREYFLYDSAIFLQINFFIHLYMFKCNIYFYKYLLNFSIMTKNRRFPFERTKENISVEDFSTTNEQLYSIIRQYASICRYNGLEKPPRHFQQQIVPNEENYRLNQLIHHLKQERDDHHVDTNNFSALRNHNIQHWKYVKSQWQKYYCDEIKKQQEIFDNLIKTPL